MIKTEAGSGPGATATVEALMNRSILTSNTIKEELNSGFYGPIKSGAAQRADMSPSDRAAAQRAIDEVGGGSNLIQGRTDQGSGNDPGVNLPGRIKVPGTNEIFNYWEGRRGGRDFSVRDSQRFAESQQRQVREGGDAAPAQPSAGDASLGSGADRDISATAKLKHGGQIQSEGLLVHHTSGRKKGPKVSPKFFAIAGYPCSMPSTAKARLRDYCLRGPRVIMLGVWKRCLVGVTRIWKASRLSPKTRKM